MTDVVFRSNDVVLLMSDIAFVVNNPTRSKDLIHISGMDFVGNVGELWIEKSHQMTFVFEIFSIEKKNYLK